MSLTLQELSDRAEIADVLTNYTIKVDTRDWAGLSEVFTEDAILDYTKVDGPKGNLAEVAPWIEKGLAGFDRYQHILGQIEIKIDGDTATAKAYFTNPMVMASDGTETILEVGGYYLHKLRRTPAGWRSSWLYDDVIWMR